MGDEETGDAFFDRVAETADAGGDDGGAAGHCLHGHQAERFVPGGNGDDISRAVEAGQEILRLGANEAEAVGDARGLDLVANASEGTDRFTVGVEVTADEEDERGRAGGVLVEEPRRFDESFNPLDRVDAADEQDDRLVGGETEGGAALVAILGLKEINVDARGNRANLVGGGAQAPDEVGALVRVGGDDAVRQVEQATFGAETQSGFVVGETVDRVFHMGGGVEHLEEGCVPIAANQMGGPARQPVVGMDCVVTNARAKRIKDHLGGKIWKKRKDRILIERFGGAGGDVDEAHPWAKFDRFRGVGGGAPGEDIDGEPGLGELAGEIADVDVHPSRVFPAEGRERAGMNRNLGHAA